MNTSAITLRNLGKRFGNVTAVDGIDLAVAEGEFFSLVGPSGCGKTTLLRLIAGFEQADNGDLQIGGVRMNEVPPQRRPVNTVFQNYALFPHLTVFENVAFGLRVRKVTTTELSHRVHAALELLHVAELRDRVPSQISGGQKQRVALARALVVEPKVLLLDEPLAAVDAQRRAQVQEDLKSLQRHSRTTFIYVTHDQAEALSLSDRMAVMSAGRIAQLGTPAEVYERPRNRFVAAFLGRCNLLHGTVVSRNEIETSIGRLRVAEPLPEKTEATLGIRAERIVLNSPAGENSVSAKVKSGAYTGALTEYLLDAQGTELRVLASGGAPFEIGATLNLRLPAEALFRIED